MLVVEPESMCRWISSISRVFEHPLRAHGLSGGQQHDRACNDRVRGYKLLPVLGIDVGKPANMLARTYRGHTSTLGFEESAD